MKWKSDIQGLRALAIALVVLSHLNFFYLQGGYLGVDVFFVISGYLITNQIVKEYAANAEKSNGLGWFSLRAFYLRRIKRIVPLALLVLLTTSIASYLLFNDLRSKTILEDAIWSSIFLANLHFIQVKSDYFSSNFTESPLQHFWSLAVEEQFYLLFPTLLIGALSLHGLRIYKYNLWWERRISILICSISLLSFFWAINRTNADPSSSYFSFSTRAWELGLGAYFAIITRDKNWNLSKSIRESLTVAGLMAILISAWKGRAQRIVELCESAISDQSSFQPSISVVIPTVGNLNLNRAILSALEQSYPVNEVIVVLDADEEIDCVTDSRVKVIKNLGKKGANAARNLGISVSKSEIICLLDDDDYWLPNKIEKQLRSVGINKRVSTWISWHPNKSISEYGYEKIHSKKEYKSNETIASYLFKRTKFKSGLGQIQSSTVMFPRFLGLENPFDESIDCHQDLTWILEIFGKRINIQWIFVDSPLTVFCVNESGISSNISAAKSESILSKYFTYIPRRAQGDYYLDTYLRLAIRANDRIQVRNAWIKAIRRLPHFRSVVVAIYKELKTSKGIFSLKRASISRPDASRDRFEQGSEDTNS